MTIAGTAFPKPRDIPREPEVIHYPEGPHGREVIELSLPEGKAEYRRRVEEMWKRQKGICCLYGHIPNCPGRLRLESATFEHEGGGRGMGGSRRDDRIVLPDGRWQNGACHYKCNREKSSRRIFYNNRDRERLP